MIYQSFGMGDNAGMSGSAAKYGIQIWYSVNMCWGMGYFSVSVNLLGSTLTPGDMNTWNIW